MGMNSAPKPKPMIATLTFLSKTFLSDAFAMSSCDSTKMRDSRVAWHGRVPRGPIGREYLLRSRPDDCNRHWKAENVAKPRCLPLVYQRPGSTIQWGCVSATRVAFSPRRKRLAG